MAEINLDEDKYEINIEEDALEIKLTEFLTMGAAGSGDMQRYIYDPQLINGDSFNRSNHTGEQEPDTIAQNSDNRFVSDAEKASWSDKANAIHGHTKDQVGLSLVDNTSDANKPTSDATQVKLNLKRDQSDYRFGTVDNNTEFESDGTMVMKGSATAWEDIQSSLIGRRLSSNQGTVDYDYEENTVNFSQNGEIDNINDCIIFSYQHPHKAKQDSSLNLHIHFEQSSNTEYEFTVWYRVQSVGGTKVDTWTEVVVNTTTGNKFQYVSGTLNQICELTSIDMTGAGISAQIQFRMTRTDSNGGVVPSTFVDAHYEIDTLGSNEEYIK